MYPGFWITNEVTKAIVVDHSIQATAMLWLLIITSGELR